MRRNLAFIGVALLLGACAIQLPSPQPSSESGETISWDDEGMPTGTDSLEVSSSEPQARTGALVVQLTDDGGFLLRRKDAPIDLPILHEFIAYECEYCAEYTRTQRPWIIAEYISNDLLALERHFVYATPWGERLARAALCSEKQGKFFELDEAFFANAPKNESALQAMIASLKLSQSAMRSCMAQKNLLPNPLFPSGKAVERVPAFAIGETEWIGIEGDDVVRERIEEAL